MSAPTVSKAKTSYPIFAATFAYNHPGFLIVGGGGGSGRSGVSNQITAFDVTSRAPKLEPVADLELSRDEDSVTCLANLATKDGVILYAGVNSMEEERLKGKNEHFRAFEVAFPKAKKAGNEKDEGSSQGTVSFLSKTRLFNTPSAVPAKKEGYQRLVRLSPPKRTASGSKRIGAIASSLADKENEIVIFSATTTKPSSQDVIQRISLKGDEANDVDILEPEDGQYQIAYCTDYDVFVEDLPYDFGRKKIQGKPPTPAKKYTVPFPDVFEKKGRFKIRCIRWLSHCHLLLLVNLPNRSGVELRVLRVYGDTMGTITLCKSLPRSMKAAVDMDTSLLDADSDGAYQAVVAVGGIDISLQVYIIDYHGKSRNSLGSFHSFINICDVHPLQMTKLTFSPFFSPWTSPQASEARKPGPQYLRLASTSLGNTISVETFELQPYSKKSKSRYILSSASSRNIHKGAIYFTIAFVALVIAVMISSFIDPEGTLTEGIVPQSLRDRMGSMKPPGVLVDEARVAGVNAMPDGVKVPAARPTQRLRDLLDLHQGEDQQKALVFHHDPETESPLSAEVHADTEEVAKKHTEAKTWEELSREERKRWTQKLSDAGMWAVEEGETVLKGIFFSEAGGLVGQIAQGVLHG
ncbi:hypothetical protein P154DRAFT_492673 [Amniculicola lignicola CBS 123094]|uniref:Guanine nucleotide-exchange factor SEC12 n=1 Tax=Amniculicola lignicola CBS 123094 TaxID=1392246 RepID=A0A6A5WE10_9PLEO|nr:hypothetical protein P154DRAFT_492673 [Amniculicola lignicola CBS 123094]